MADHPKHSPISSEPQNHVPEPAAPAPEGTEINAANETHAGGVAKPAIRIMPGSGASTHPPGS